VFSVCCESLFSCPHREQVDLHWSKEVFKDREQMVQTLARARPKLMAVDFAWRAVEDNRELAGKLLQKDEKRLLDLVRGPPAATRGQGWTAMRSTPYQESGL